MCLFLNFKKCFFPRVFLFLILCLNATICLGSTHKLDFYKSSLRSVLLQDIHRYNIPGASLSVGKIGGGIINIAVGMSDIQKKQKLEPGQLFIIGSVSKSFLAAVVLNLIQQGKINLNNTLGQLSRSGTRLETILTEYPKLKSITLKQLLTHTSGLGKSINSKAFSKLFSKQPLAYWSKLEFISLSMNSERTKINLGRLGRPHKFYYTNTNYYLVGLAISSVTHQSVRQLIKKIIRRAGLKNTFVPNIHRSVFSNRVLSKLAHGYVTPTQGGWSMTFMRVFQHYPKVRLPGIKEIDGYDITPLALSMSRWDFPAGGIVSSSQDLVYWFEALFSGKIVNMDTLNQLYSWVPMGNGGCYGLAIKKRYLKKFRVQVYYHGGDQLAYVTNLIYLKPYKIVIALTTNLDNDYTDYVTKGIISDVLKQLIN